MAAAPEGVPGGSESSDGRGDAEVGEDEEEFTVGFDAAKEEDDGDADELDCVEDEEEFDDDEPDDDVVDDPDEDDDDVAGLRRRLAVTGQDRRRGQLLRTVSVVISL